MIFSKQKDKDLIVNLMRLCEEKDKTIDKLTDKLIAVTSPEAVGVYNPPEDTPAPLRDDPYVDIDEAPADEALNSLNARPTNDQQES